MSARFNFVKGQHVKATLGDSVLVGVVRDVYPYSTQPQDDIDLRLDGGNITVTVDGEQGWAYELAPTPIPTAPGVYTWVPDSGGPHEVGPYVLDTLGAWYILSADLRRLTPIPDLDLPGFFVGGTLFKLVKETSK